MSQHMLNNLDDDSKNRKFSNLKINVAEANKTNEVQSKLKKDQGGAIMTGPSP